jgi:cyclase
VAWAAEATQRHGAGEILLTSMDRDGTGLGYDLELLHAVADATTVPLIASGGAGTPEHFAEGLRVADAVLAASRFHDGDLSIVQVKEHLTREGIQVRR